MSIENYGTQPAHDYPVPGSGVDEEADKPAHPLDSEASKKELKRLLEWYHQEREKQSINRYQQSIDDDYYDHLQWSDQDAQELRERGQAPLVFNEIKPVIDWIIGTERRTRIDYKILPREDDDVEGALTKTKLFKYVSDVNMEPFEQSDAFAECVRVGVGWLEEGIRKDPEKEPLYVSHESWRNMLYDSNGLKSDTSDWRYIYRWRWLDLDIAQAAFPDRAEVLRRASVSSELYGPEQDEDLWYLGQRLQERDAEGNVIGRRTFVSDANYVNNRRERVRLIEGWYRMPVNGRFMQGGSFHGKEFDSGNADMMAEFNAGGATLYDRLHMQMRVAIFTESDLVLLQKSPYRHNGFPFTPVWGYRRKRDNAPYGAIRGIRDPQDDVNKRGSKALWLLSSNQTIADKGAFDDPDEAREELNRPDAFVIKNAGKEVIRENQRDLAESHMKMQEQSANRIRQVAGVTGENLGMETNATSGKAIIARQTQGTVVTTELFDNYRRARQISGQKQLSLIEQFYTDEKVVRITGDKGKADFLTINQPNPNGDGLLNDITKSQADFIIGEQDYSLSLRVAMFETMLEMVTRMPPEVALKFLDLVFEFSDLPNKSDIVSRLRSISGVVPPDDKMTPDDRKQLAETRAQQAKAAGAQQMLAEAQVEHVAATIDKLRAEVAKLKADTAKINVGSEVLAVGTVGKSLTGAAAIAAEPRIAPIADAILASGGFTDATPGAGVGEGAPTAVPVPPVPAAVPPVTQPPTGMQP